MQLRGYLCVTTLSMINLLSGTNPVQATSYPETEWTRRHSEIWRFVGTWEGEAEGDDLEIAPDGAKPMVRRVFSGIGDRVFAQIEVRTTVFWPEVDGAPPRQPPDWYPQEDLGVLSVEGPNDDFVWRIFDGVYTEYVGSLAQEEFLFLRRLSDVDAEDEPMTRISIQRLGPDEFIERHEVVNEISNNWETWRTYHFIRVTN
jgi:hypothetical protein